MLNMKYLLNKNMLLRFRILLLAAMIAFATQSASSQNVSFIAKTDTNNVLIGDQIKLHLIAKSDKKTNIILPTLPDTINKIEVRWRSKIDTLDSAGLFRLKQTYIITCFDSGYHTLPPFDLSYEQKGSAGIITTSSDSIVLKFITIPVDTSKAFKDIKPPLDSPITFMEILPYIGIFLLVLAMVWLAVYFWKKRNKVVTGKPEYDPRIPPHVIALEALKLLDADKLWQKGYVKQYFIRLTEIIWVYIERRFDITAPEMTSGEIIEALRAIQLDPVLIGNMNKLFVTADLVKFAKDQPLPDENSLLLTYAFDFIHKTFRKSDSISNQEQEN